MRADCTRTIVGYWRVLGVTLFLAVMFLENITRTWRHLMKFLAHAKLLSSSLLLRFWCKWCCDETRANKRVIPWKPLTSVFRVSNFEARLTFSISKHLDKFRQHRTHVLYAIRYLQQAYHPSISRILVLSYPAWFSLRGAEWNIPGVRDHVQRVHQFEVLPRGESSFGRAEFISRNRNCASMPW